MYLNTQFAKKLVYHLWYVRVVVSWQIEKGPNFGITSQTKNFGHRNKTRNCSNDRKFKHDPCETTKQNSATRTKEKHRRQERHPATFIPRNELVRKVAYPEYPLGLGVGLQIVLRQHPRVPVAPQLPPRLQKPIHAPYHEQEPDRQQNVAVHFGRIASPQQYVVDHGTDAKG